MSCRFAAAGREDAEAEPAVGGSQQARAAQAKGFPAMIPIVLTARALRAFADGFVAVLLPAYLLALGHGQLAVGFLGTAALLGSALATLAVGRWGNRYSLRRMLMACAALMVATGLGFAGLADLWPLLLVAFLGPLNPSGGDVSVFLPLEQSVLAGSTKADARTSIFARYSFIGSIFGALGALAAALPDWMAGAGWQMTEALRIMFILYAIIGVVVWALYLRIPQPPTGEIKPRSSLGASRSIVLRLAALFSVDSFAGGLVINALLALWLFERFGMSLTAAGAFFFWTGLFSAVSQLAAVPLARRIGLVNTMVFTHIPASLCLIGAAFATTLELAVVLLLVRSLLSQMDVPARSSYVMSVVTPAERPAAASVTAVARSMAAALGPIVAGAWFASGDLVTPLLACGVLKIAYDLALFLAFRRVSVRAEVEEA
jgi:MFS family permease